MFKRLFWLVLGVIAGFAASSWLSRRLRRTLSRLAPDRMAGTAAQTARQAANEIKAALNEGRQAMRERESELRAEIGRPGP